MDAQKILLAIRAVDHKYDALGNLGFWGQCDNALAAGMVPQFGVPKMRMSSDVRAVRIELRADLFIELLGVDGLFFIERTYAPWLQPITTLPLFATDQYEASRILAGLVTPPQAVVIH